MKKILIAVFCLLSISIFSQSTETVAIVAEIVPSQGFSLSSLWRGVLGMVALIVIAFLFSANKKAVDWKKVAIGLFLQLIIAVGVLKIEFIQSIFEFVGGIFIEILGYTKAGSEFLFAGIVGINSGTYLLFKFYQRLFSFQH
jgi:CNT family concentrative nucleoside transporter